MYKGFGGYIKWSLSDEEWIVLNDEDLPQTTNKNNSVRATCINCQIQETGNGTYSLLGDNETSPHCIKMKKCYEQQYINRADSPSKKRSCAFCNDIPIEGSDEILPVDSCNRRHYFCPAGFYGKIVTHSETIEMGECKKCPAGFFCPEGTQRNPALQENLNQKCVFNQEDIKIDTDLNTKYYKLSKDKILCSKLICPAGYLCPEGTKGNSASPSKKHLSILNIPEYQCPRGYFCPQGSSYIMDLDTDSISNPDLNLEKKSLRYYYHKSTSWIQFFFDSEDKSKEDIQLIEIPLNTISKKKTEPIKLNPGNYIISFLAKKMKDCEKKTDETSEKFSLTFKIGNANHNINKDFTITNCKIKEYVAKFYVHEMDGLVPAKISIKAKSLAKEQNSSLLIRNILIHPEILVTQDKLQTLKCPAGFYCPGGVTKSPATSGNEIISIQGKKQNRPSLSTRSFCSKSTAYIPESIIQVKHSEISNFVCNNCKLQFQLEKNLSQKELEWLILKPNKGNIVLKSKNNNISSKKKENKVIYNNIIKDAQQYSIFTSKIRSKCNPKNEGFKSSRSFLLVKVFS